MTIELAWGLWGGLNRLLFSSVPALPVVRRLLVVVVSGIAIVSGIAAAKAQVRLPAERGVVELRAKQQRKEGDVFIAEGDVDIRFQDLRLRADRVEYNDSTSVAIARGNVKFDLHEQHLDAEEARYNLRTGLGTFRRVRGSVQIERRPNPALLVTPNPLYFEAREVERRGERTYIIRHAWVTVCAPDRPKWTFYAPRATLTLDKSVALVNTNFRLLDRKSTRLNYSHRCNSYDVFCLI